jgi:hypothetical protein
MSFTVLASRFQADRCWLVCTDFWQYNEEDVVLEVDPLCKAYKVNFTLSRWYPHMRTLGLKLHSEVDRNQ